MRETRENRSGRGKGRKQGAKKKVYKNRESKEFSYSVDKWIKDRVGEKSQATRELRNETIQLYEKGLLSAQTVLDVFGFDEAQEIKRKNDDSIDTEVQQKNLGSRNYNEVDIKQMRIEQARRNVEALAKLSTCSTAVNNDVITGAIVKNIEIMGEVEKI